MASVKILLPALVVFFSAAGLQIIVEIYRRARRELGCPERRLVRWIDVPGLLLLATIPGALRLFFPKRVECYTTVFVVVFLKQEGVITGAQATDYLRTKGIQAVL